MPNELNLVGNQFSVLDRDLLHTVMKEMHVCYNIVSTAEIIVP